MMRRAREGEAPMLIIAQDERDNVVRRYDADLVPRIGEMVFLFDPERDQPICWRVKDVQWQLRKPEGTAVLVVLIVEPERN